MASLAELLCVHVGTGTGYVALELLMRGYSVTVVDLSRNLLSICLDKIKKSKAEGRLLAYRMDACDMGVFSDGTFYIVISQGDTISYASHPRQAIEECTRILRPNVIISISIANRWFHTHRHLREGKIEDSRKAIKDGLSYWLDSSKGSFTIYAFSMTELEKIIEANSCRVIHKLNKLPIPRDIT